MPETTTTPTIPRYPLYLSIAAALLTIGMKWSAYRLTGSLGLLSDAAESLVNLVAAIAATLSLWYASRPIDPSHTFGHEKIEYFSSGLEGGLILVAAAGIAWQAVERLLDPRALVQLDIGTMLAIGASAINFAVALVLLRAGRAYQSVILEADGLHLLTDVWTSIGVVVSLGLVWLTNLTWLDPVIAIGVSLYILKTGFTLVLRAFDGLMDHALPDTEQQLLHATITATLLAEMDYHAVRTRRAGARRFVDFHLLVPGAWTVEKAHAISDGIEEEVRKAIPGLEVTIHIEPIEEKTAWEDSELLALESRARRALKPKP